MSAARNGFVLAAVAAAAVFASGCSSDSCNVNPALGHAPTSCTLPTQRQVTVPVSWCDCGAPTSCDVTFTGGTFFISPRVDSCDASCPSSCSVGVEEGCTFTAPATGTYQVTIANGLGEPQAATFTVTSSGSVACN